jgi:hypothetical protein
MYDRRNIMIGTMIANYEILDKLGEGGMSQNGPRTLFVSGCRFDPEEIRGAEAKREREVSI